MSIRWWRGTACSELMVASIWGTIDGGVDVDEITDEEELEDLMVEPTAGELGILSDTDVRVDPGDAIGSSMSRACAPRGAVP